MKRPPRPSVAELAAGVRAGDRALLARAITLVESRRVGDQADAQGLLERLLPHTGGAHRIGVTGVPGVGKSTFIEAFGERLVADGRRVAVLAVDPTSSLTGGSILGDKARMHALAQNPRAFIRPSPSGGSLGGIARRTRESLLVLEAAGHDVVLVETVGVGQSEITVADMVDSFLVLLLPGGGDELQGIKRGVLELADILAINKADGEMLAAARATCRDHEAALRYLKPRSSFRPRALTISAKTGDGLERLEALLEEHRQTLEKSGEWTERRAEQRRRWMWSLVDESLHDLFRTHPSVTGRIEALEERVVAGQLPPTLAARELLEAFRSGS